LSAEINGQCGESSRRYMKIDITFFIIVGCGILLLYWIISSLQ